MKATRGEEAKWQGSSEKRMKEKNMSVSGEGRRDRRRIILLQSSQASLARPSDKNIKKLKTLERLEDFA
jgi:hypothetical protein